MVLGAKMRSALYPHLITTLKALLKKKGLSYENLAERSGIPLSTLKKNLTAEDCSLNRLDEICRAADLSLEDLINANQKESQQAIHFSEEQEEHFKKNLPAFHVYWNLVYERRTLEDTGKRCRLAESEIKKLLLQLDRLNLIELHPGNRIKLPALRPVRWARDSDFMKQIQREWAEKLLKDCSHGEEDPERFALQFFQLRKETIAELKNTLASIEEEFSRRTIREMRLYPNELIPVRVALLRAQGSFLN